MRIVDPPLPLAEGEKLATLLPPNGMSDEDCETINIVRAVVQLPTGRQVPTVRAWVELDEGEVANVVAAGGHFWLEFIGVTFPPVMLWAPEAPDTACPHDPDGQHHVGCGCETSDVFTDPPAAPDRVTLERAIADAIHSWAASANLDTMPPATRDTVIAAFATDAAVKALDALGVFGGDHAGR